MPAAPTETAITQESYDSEIISIQVSWVSPADNGASITGYLLYMSEQSIDYELIYNGTNRADITTYTARNKVKRSTGYRFKVLAINRIGQSTNSTALESFAAVVPSTPLNFTHSDSQSGSVTLIWEPPLYDGGAKITGYYIYYKVAGSLPWSKTSLVNFDK